MLLTTLSNLLPTRYAIWRLIFWMSIIASIFCLATFAVVISEKVQSPPIRKLEWVSRAEGVESEFEFDIQRLKLELQLRNDQEDVWYQVELAFRESSLELIRISPKMFDGKMAFIQRINLMTAENQNSEVVRNLCGALKSLFYNLDDKQRNVLEQRVLAAPKLD